ncbi:Lsr2 family protein [Williamsia sp. DF01-3]|uniref:histone-like nucleoid-structuring protein Lsr2 n=1 Tax=Williamsia sp. DF01-3 TaxID=2934157 RepID=UPI001FF23A9A|nr:Lsr2 family protein [Williamsia sp. DF01-3]MCK0517437.1 Lsr2 family protein [Williamsia sp. DF01-3]
MAKKTVVEFVDDLDGKPIEIDDLNTIEWSWRGVDYVFDTSTTNLEKIENGKMAVTTLLSKSTRVGGRRRSGSAPRRAAGSNGSVDDAGDRPVIRAWARDHGYGGIGDRGRIAKHIVAAYYEQAGDR